jgi:flagella basal body P-ring formation protein FlgA
VTQNGGEKQAVAAKAEEVTAAAPRELGVSRTIGRRRALPSSRAITGGFLVALAALGVFVAASGAGRTSKATYVIVARDVPAGTTVTGADLAMASMDLPAEIAGHAFSNSAAVVGRIAVAHLSAGDLLFVGQTIELPAITL